MRLIKALVIVPLLAVFSCSNTQTQHDNPVVRVDNYVLTRQELNENIPHDLSPEDSLIIAEHFVKVWIVEKLLYKKASENILDEDYIDQLVENYRKSLVVYQYKEQLINEKLSKEITQDELLQYYEANQDRFQLDRPLVKGLFLRIPLDAPSIEKVRAWSKSPTPSALTNIEKYCIQNAFGFDYIVDDWVDFNEWIANWPIDFNISSDIVKNNKYIERKDDYNYYFLYITDYLLPGDKSPFEYARATIREMLVNQKKVSFLKTLEEELYKKALTSGQISFYDN